MVEHNAEVCRSISNVIILSSNCAILYVRLCLQGLHVCEEGLNARYWRSSVCQFHARMCYPEVFRLNLLFSHSFHRFYPCQKGKKNKCFQSQNSSRPGPRNPNTHFDREKCVNNCFHVFLFFFTPFIVSQFEWNSVERT